MEKEYCGCSRIGIGNGLKIHNLRVQVPPSAPISGVHIMENIAGFYPVHSGSIPLRRTRYALQVLQGNSRLIIGRGGSITHAMYQMPRWTNWQSRLSQKEKCCEFKSHSGYQVFMYGYQSGQMARIANPLFRRFESDSVLHNPMALMGLQISLYFNR